MNKEWQFYDPRFGSGFWYRYTERLTQVFHSNEWRSGMIKPGADMVPSFELTGVFAPNQLCEVLARILAARSEGYNNGYAAHQKKVRELMGDANV